jgi:hypothetical protein
VANLVPVVGPIASTLIAATAGLAIAPATAAAIVGLYILVQLIAGRLAGSSVEGVHPGIMAVIAVVLSQLGFGWALLTIPLVTISRGVFLYAYGRVSDPPRPAGELPGARAAAYREATASRIPLVYRRAVTRRSSEL